MDCGAAAIRDPDDCVRIIGFRGVPIVSAGGTREGDASWDGSGKTADGKTGDVPSAAVESGSEGMVTRGYRASRDPGAWIERGPSSPRFEAKIP
jgi:hypothetical protein